MAEQDQDRNEAATPFKLEEARKKGSVPKSLDVNSWVILGAGLLALYIWGGKMLDAEMSLASQILSHSHHASFELNELIEYVTSNVQQALLILAPLFLLVICFGALANFLQIGPVFSFFPLKPDWNRINPVAGFKRMFSMRLLIESFKTVLKFLLLGSVLYLVLGSSISHLLMAFHVSPVATGRFLIPEMTKMLFYMFLVLTFVALIDLVFSRWDFAKRMRMSRRDIKDEHKRREGDPRLKSRLRELQREAVKRAKSLSRVKDADVLITNPTHLAIAIQYNRDVIDAPLVIAKGAGFLAGRMKALARKHKVPMVENRPLARALFHKVQLEQAVPAEYFGIVAKILFWSYSIRGVRLPARRPA
ncbi:flagellar biosynthesis protein FlhB [Methylobacillus arboreus]|uniref:flagellar biosynthesis protein FlhB n=1 Tax=Methylobacillus arboreus TaxID=755170 RepID=UPI001E5E38F7|nr:flagellar biosynthesis protein FlhB [Methylobacillus arboreus]MCB5191869.1 flagellar biosynthesis protein FlhB [Methylobacillus arboreus]